MKKVKSFKAMITLVVIIATNLFGYSQPNFLWAKQAGGANNDNGNEIAVDGSGNSYITGGFQGTATFGNTTLTSAGEYDLFIAKIDEDGNFLWAKKVGGVGPEYGNSIAVDGSGNSYITGFFYGTATFGNTTLTSAGYDIFIAKTDASGNFLWAKKAGGTNYDSGNSIAVDGSGNSYITGYFFGTATFGNTTLTSAGWTEIFIAKIDASGNFLWAKKAGGANNDSGYSIAVDGSGNSYTIGGFEGTATFGNISLTSVKDANGKFTKDIFIAKIDGNGNFLWAKQAGGANNDSGNSIAVDGSGNSYITGSFDGTITFGNTTLTSAGSDIFIAKLDGSGNYLWAKKTGGTSVDSGNSIAVDGSGNSYITGFFYGTATFGNTTLTSAGGGDVFISKLDNNGNFIWTKKADGTGDDSGNSIAIDGSGNSYTIGNFQGTATFGNTTLTSAGYDIFIAKIGTITTGNEEIVIPKVLELSQNYPNPFDNSTNIEFTLFNPSKIKLTVFNSFGQVVDVIVDEFLFAGNHSYTWNPKNVASGMYFYQLNVDGNKEVKRMVKR